MHVFWVVSLPSSALFLLFVLLFASWAELVGWGSCLPSKYLVVSSFAYVLTKVNKKVTCTDLTFKRSKPPKRLKRALILIGQHKTCANSEGKPILTINDDKLKLFTYLHLVTVECLDNVEKRYIIVQLVM